MIPTANQELCLELSRVSEWNNTYYEWYWHTEKGVEPMQIVSRSIDDVTVYDKDAEFCPAYDISYLLRKLPPDTDLKHVYPKSKNFYWMATSTGDTEVWCETADIPEDALAILAFVMIGAGVLK